MRQCVRVWIPGHLPPSLRLILRVCSLEEGSDVAAHRLSGLFHDIEGSVSMWSQCVTFVISGTPCVIENRVFLRSG